MGKQKQQIISRFFTPKPKPDSPTPPPSVSSSSFLKSDPTPTPNPVPPTPPRKVTTTVSFSPAKRKLLSDHLASSTLKNPKLSPHTQNPIPDPSLHQRFLQKLLEPPVEVPVPSTRPLSKYTPLEQQVVELKAKYPDVLLMVEVGYRYRFFGEDAEIAARLLRIYAHVDRNFVTASIPTFRLNVHVRRLVSAGYKVGVVKQTETAAIKAHGSNKVGPFCRDLSALYTKATLQAAEDLGGGGEDECGGESNYLVCVVEKSVCVENVDNCVESGFDVRMGVVGIEISTGDVVHGEFNDNLMRTGLEAVILSISPAELLLGEPLSKQTEKLLLAYAGPASNVRVERASRDHFSAGDALSEVMSIYENVDADKQIKKTEAEHGDYALAIQGIMNMPDLAVQALALATYYLKQFGFERIVCLGASFRSLSSCMEMILSANALQQLEVLKNNSNGSESGSLLRIMNQTLTIYGSRLLRHWVTHPLSDRNMISARLDAVSEIAESMSSSTTSQTKLEEDNSDPTTFKPEFYYLLSSVLTTLAKSPDIQRGITRIFHRTATATEFIAVIQAILYAGKQLQRLHLDRDYDGEKVQLVTVRSALLRKLILTAASSSVVGNAAKLLSSLNKEAADQGDIPNLITGSQFPELARARQAVQAATEKLDCLIGVYQKQFRMRNLEFLSVSGTTHLIELPTDVKVPLDWVKINSTKKTIRYHPPEVLSSLNELSLANEELAIVCRAAWDSFLRGFTEYYAEFQAAVQALAALDCLHSFATLAKNKNYVRPVFVYDDEPVQIQICSGRHPVLDNMLQDSFVPNDTSLHADGEYCQIVTGPNMGGKSCYIRQVALIAIMAQVGSFVPAASAKLHVFDGVYTRMGASDSIQLGRSTFLEELSEASNILHNCSARSLVIMDELGRGTSTHDGVAIAYATLHHLLTQKKCMVLFVTHYPKIAELTNELPGSVGAYHVSYLTSHKNMPHTDSESDHEDVTYLYRLVPGVSERSFGFKVANLAQIPSTCINRAISMAERLEALVSSRVGSRCDRMLLTYQEQGGGSPECEKNENSEEEFSDFFINLKSALFNKDLAKCFQLLKHAQSTAEQLINR